MKPTAYALKNRITVYVLVVFIVLVGISTYRSLPVEATPDVQIPIVLVKTVFPGVAPADVESLVTNPLERELKDLRDVRRMSSTSAESISIITIEFETEVDMDEAYQKVRDQVDQAAPDLPPEAEEPQLEEINLSEFPIMLVNLYGEVGLVRLKAIAEGLEDELEQIPGVLDVEVVGGLEREVQVLLDPAAMEFHKIGVNKVIERIQQEHRTTPGGTLDLGDSKFLVRIPGEYEDVRRMEDMVLKAPDGHPVKLRQIGRVVDGYAERETISRVNGREGVTLRIQKRAGENIVAIADAARAELAEQAPLLPPGVGLLVRQDQSDNVRTMVADLENSIITGLVLVLAVLLFVMGARNAFFVAVAIPLSMLLTFITLGALGITLNMVVLFSLILALGMLVDNSIVVMENIYRHVSAGESRLRAALSATREVGWAIVASTTTTVLAFAPLLLWPGVMGEFMTFLPKTVITALLASLFVALVINPVMASGLLKARRPTGDQPAGQPQGRAGRFYRRLLAGSLDRPGWVMLGALAVFVTIGLLFGRYGAGVELFPDTTPDRAIVSVEAPEGTVLEKTDRLAERVEKLARAEPEVEDVVVGVGVGSGGGDSPRAAGSTSSHLARIELEFRDRAQRRASTWDTIASLRRAVRGLPGAQLDVTVEKIGPPTGAPISVEVSGPDFERLTELSSRIQASIARVPGVIEIRDDHESGKPEVRVLVDREEAMLRKVNTAAIAQAIRTGINGTTAAVLRDGEDEIDIVVRFDESHRRSINDLLGIAVTGRDDVQVPLRDVAEVRTEGGVGSVRHVDQERTVTVTADVSGRSSTEALAEVQALLAAELTLPPGYGLAYSGENEEQQKAVAFLQRAFGIGLLLILLVLITQFNSLLQPLIILASVAMSMFGVLLGLVLTQHRFGIIMTGMGVISLAGVVVNNAIVLIDYINQLRRRHGLSLREALLRAGVVRSRPVLLTAVTTILGLLPMALNTSFDFASLSLATATGTSEWWGPMAQAVIFGLAFSTLLTLFLVPVMVLLLERLSAWSRTRMLGLARLARRLQRTTRRFWSRLRRPA
jgi:CzcA family heavy metal efflux pump